MKQAVIKTGGKQYVVKKNDVLDVESLGDAKTVNFTPLMVFDDNDVTVGEPEVKGAKVSAKVLEQIRDDKVVAIRYKAKKRVHKKHGHRQNYSRIQITDIK
ncbi:TPA: 50S ribosomal protein L21 [Candidatus Saccharibacteria bacterium]|nr:50S ribosomal protein L21 [Candidatus Saccharibacteria bacterium]HIO87207.1 50S ribosomal protein L21 [Candidatus Saccharibacteria bacterium]